MSGPLENRVEYLIEEWRRQADELETGFDVDDRLHDRDAGTLRICADVLEQGLTDARELGSLGGVG